MEYIKKQVAERDSLATQIVSMAEKAAHEDRSLTDQENSSIAGMKARVDVLDAELRQWKDIQSAVVNFTPIAEAVAEKAQASKDDDPTGEWRSVGELWTSSEQWKDYSQRPRGNSGMLQVPFDSFETRATLLTTTYAGVIPKDRIQPSMAPTAQTPLRSLVNTISVSGNSVEWVFYPAAAPLGTITAEGAPKTEAAVTLTLQTVTLDTIASWAKYSRQFAADGPGLVDFINQALSRGINDKIESLIATELTTNASIPVTTNTGGTLLAGIRKAVGAVQTAGFTPQAAVVNPADLASLDLSVMGITFNGPQTNATFWGIQVVPVGAVPSGTSYVGDFNTGMAWLQRQDVTVYTTDSDISGAGATAASDFRSNILTTLAEARGKAITHRPEALTKVSGTVPAADTAASAEAARQQQTAKK